MNIAHSPLHAAVGFDAEFPDSGGDDRDADFEFEPSLSVALDAGRYITFFGSARGSFSPGEATGLLKEGQKPDDPGTLSGGGLVAVSHVTIALEYTNRSDDQPWRLDGAPLVTPSIIVHPGGDWELGFAMPFGVRTNAHKPGLGVHLIKEFGGR